jgi:hypothetical protein
MRPVESEGAGEPLSRRIGHPVIRQNAFSGRAFAKHTGFALEKSDSHNSDKVSNVWLLHMRFISRDATIGASREDSAPRI